MHIVKQLLDGIGNELQRNHRVYVNPHDWDSFQKPLEFQNGALCRDKFEERQQTSIRIIESILDIHGKVGIVGFLAKLAKIEPRIQELQPWVRDHVVHAIGTYLLGVFFLEKLRLPPLDHSRLDYPFMWKLCGPTHDLGYPVEIAHNINVQFSNEMNEILESIGSPSPKVRWEAYPINLDRLCDDVNSNHLIQKRIEEWELDLDINDYYLWLRRLHRTDHGVVSALAQLKVVDALYYQANPRKERRNVIINDLNFNYSNFELDIVSASSALFLHNIDISYPGFTNKISFQKAPLAFLLFLCDSLQEWDRYSENRSVYSGEDFEVSCGEASIALTIPVSLEEKVSKALTARLTGLNVQVNGKIVID